MDDPCTAQSAAEIERALRQLRKLERRIFLAHRLDELSYAEIASTTGLSVEQVERHMASAIAAIDRALCKPSHPRHPRRWWWPF